MKTPKKKNNQAPQLLNFIVEAGMLKRVARSGWWVVGIDNPESVAEHSFRCAVIGYVIAKSENADVYPVLVMTLFGDLHEARINDLHKMVQRYLPVGKAEEEAFQDQCSALPMSIKSELSTLRAEYLAQHTKESLIARDADILECLIQAKEYYEHGFTQAAKFMKKAPQFLKTKTARELWRTAQSSTLNNWWQGLSEFKR